MNENNKTANILNFIIAFLGVLTPGAYLIGLSFYQGAISAYGVDPATFPSSAPDVYVTAYYAIGHFLLAISEIVAKLLNKIFISPVIYYMIAATFALILITYLALKHYEKVKSSKFWLLVSSVVRYLHWKNNNFTRSIGIVGIASYGLMTSLFVLIMIAIFWWAAPYAAYNNAQKIEKEKIDLFLENGCHENEISNWNNCVTILNRDNIVMSSGIFIAANTEGIAIFKADGSYFYNLKDEYIIKHSYKGKIQHNTKMKADD